MKKHVAGITVLASMGVFAALLAPDAALASDIACQAPVGGTSTRCEGSFGSATRCAQGPIPRRQHLVCEYTMLGLEYQRVYQSQQGMLRDGLMTNAELAAWRARRDACTSVSCLDGLFRQFWVLQDFRVRKEPRENLRANGRRHAPPPTYPPAAGTIAPTPGRSAAPVRAAGAATVREPAHPLSAATGTAAASALAASELATLAATDDAALAAMEAATQTAGESPADADTEAPPAPAVDPAFEATTSAEGSEPASPSAQDDPALSPEDEPPPVHISASTPPATPAPEHDTSTAWAMEAVISIMILLGLGAGLRWHRGRVLAGDGATPKIAVSLGMLVIAVGLLLVNALLLPFTLGTP